MKRVSSSKNNQDLYSSSMLGSGPEYCSYILVRENFSVSWCLFYFLLLSAGSPQIWFLDIDLVQVLSYLFCLVSEPGRSEPGALFFCLVSGLFRSGLGALFVLLGLKPDTQCAC